MKRAGVVKHVENINHPILDAVTPNFLLFRINYGRCDPVVAICKVCEWTEKPTKIPVSNWEAWGTTNGENLEISCY